MYVVYIIDQIHQLFSILKNELFLIKNIERIFPGHLLKN
jgi:hypothetical protein